MSTKKLGTTQQTVLDYIKASPTALRVLAISQGTGIGRNKVKHAVASLFKAGLIVRTAQTPPVYTVELTKPTGSTETIITPTDAAAVSSYSGMTAYEN